MKLSVIVLSTLATLATAQKLHNLNDKRDVQTVVQTQVDVETVNEYVTVYADDDGSDVSTSQPPATNAPAAATAAPASATPTASQVQNKVVADSSSAPASAAASGSASSSGSSSYSAPSGAGAGGALGITYSPYQNDGSCKSADAVKSDIAKLKDYNMIRIYNVDCSGVQNVLEAISSNQKLFAGLYTLSSIEADVSSMWTQIQAAGKDWSVVDTVSVGNELVNDGSATPGQIQTAVNTAKSALKGKGYNGPVVSVDTANAIQSNPSLCQYSDYIAMNCHAFFNDKTEASNAGNYVSQQIDNIKSICGGNKNVIVTESGWPNGGDTNGDAVPSEQNQEVALASIKKEVGGSVFLFTVYNDKWKQPGQFNVEQNWGIYGDSPN